MNLCMAHRGWSGQAPENTLAAYKLALTDSRIDAIEVDVQLSKDGVPVLIHDFTLERTTNGTGYVKNFTCNELQQLDAGSWFNQSFTGEKIPTLEEALTEVRGKCRVNVELKTAGDLYPQIAEKVIEIINRCEMKSQVVITSFDHEAIKRVHEIDPTFKTGLIVYGRPVLVREQLREAGASILSIAYPYLTRDFAESLLAEGVDIIAWTIDDQEAIQTIMSFHPDIQICTNHPDRMINVVGSLNK